MPAEKDILRRALGRLGRVPPDVLDLSRQRVRGNLKRELRPTAPLTPPDAAPADLTVLRRPLYIAGAAVLFCMMVLGGGVVRWRLERQSASEVAPKLASIQPSESQAPVQSPQSAVEAPPPVAPAVPKPGKKQPAAPRPVSRQPAATNPVTAATQPPAADRPPVQRTRPPVRFALLPPGAGKVILDRACDACHRAASVAAYHYATRMQYADVVARMIAKGAQVSDEEAPVLTDYLFDNLSAKPDRAAKPDSAVDTEGGAILERACTGCHDLNGLESYAYDSEDPYRDLVSTMVSYGAMLSEGEEETLVKYLFTTYGKR